MTNDNPREMTRVEYEKRVESDAEVALDERNEYPESFENLNQAVEHTISGSQMVSHRGKRLITLFHTRQNPDDPDHGQSWDLGLSHFSYHHEDALMQMAYTCYFADVMNKAQELIEERENK